MWAQALTGAGVAILYLSIYAAFGFLILVTLAAGVLAVRYETRTIAVLGVLGGFLTPVILGSALPDDRLLLAYILLWDLGVLGVAAFRNWRWLALLGLVGSFSLFGALVGPGPKGAASAGPDCHHAYLPHLCGSDYPVPHPVAQGAGGGGWGGWTWS